ncbi:molybdopterin dinucleotide binding domain-containing protein [Thermoproteota archaeon]
MGEPIRLEKFGLKDGGKYTIYNQRGQIEVTVKVTRKVLPGVIWCPRELIDEEDNPQNSLAPGIPQKIGGGPIFNTIKVRFK